MKVLMINGSPHTEGNTALALKEMEEIFKNEGIETVTLQVGSKAVRGCVACSACSKLGKCAFDDVVNEAAEILADSDGIVVASPVYYASANGTLISFLDRLFYSSKCDKRMKVAASIAVARRGGCSATYDELNKYFTINNMPIAPSQYWNSVHGRFPGEAVKDEEGMQTMRTLARNMIFMMKSFALGKEQFGLPEKEAEAKRTSFIK